MKTKFMNEAALERSVLAIAKRGEETIAALRGDVGLSAIHLAVSEGKTGALTLVLDAAGAAGLKTVVFEAFKAVVPYRITAKGFGGKAAKAAKAAALKTGEDGVPAFVAGYQAAFDAALAKANAIKAAKQAQAADPGTKLGRAVTALAKAAAIYADATGKELDVILAESFAKVEEVAVDIEVD